LTAKLLCSFGQKLCFLGHITLLFEGGQKWSKEACFWPHNLALSDSLRRPQVVSSTGGRDCAVRKIALMRFALKSATTPDIGFNG
jgi:hypothetical protein